MELKDFITSAISDIAAAVADADEVLKPMGGLVNPGKSGADMVGATYHAPRTTLNFDVAVNAASSGQGSAGIKAKILVVEASIGGGGEVSASSSSRLTFSLDVVLPHDPDLETRIPRRVR